MKGASNCKSVSALFSFLPYLNVPHCLRSLYGRVPNTKPIEPTPKDFEPSSLRFVPRSSNTYKKTGAYSARTFLLASLLLVPVFVHAGVFSAIAGFVAESESSEYTAVTAYNPQTVPLLRAVTNADPNAARGGGDIFVDGDGVLVPALGPGSEVREEEVQNGEISIYVVHEGDDLSRIAEMFDVSVNTILWANEITNKNTIKPGSTLVILPVSGVRHVVKKGDSLKAIASKYQGDQGDIIAYNQLDGASGIAVGDTIVIPGGEIIAPKVAKKKSSGGSVIAVSGSGGSTYFTHPVPGAARTQGIHGYNGVDLAAAAGTSVRAAAGGEVILARGSGWNGGYGNYIVIKHANGTQTLYAHLSQVSVGAGASVAQGEVIGGVGNTGKSTGAHLHFEVRGSKNPF